MTELIKALVNVRDAISLIAFLSLVMLVAFRTKQVPELFFGLLRDKLTRAQFAALLHRFMTFGFAAFIALVLLAIAAQVLNRMTQPNALTIDQLRDELAKSEASADARARAESQYKLAMDLVSERKLDAAVAALQESIKSVPSLTAQEMLTYLFREKGDLPKEAEAWQAAVKTARGRGDSVALARLDRVTLPRAGVSSGEGEHDLIGSSTPLPKGGDTFETAVKLSAGLYSCADKNGCFTSYYTVSLSAGQELAIGVRSPAPPACCLAGVDIYGTNGQPLARAGDNANTMRGNAGPPSTISRARWVATESGSHFVMTTADPGTVYRIQIR